MQHLTEFLNSKKLPVKETLSTYCKISEKIDGSAFQYYNDDGNIILGKRGSSPNKLSPNHITDFDILTNPMYAHATDVITKVTLPENIKILNFEIFSNNNTHIITYDNKFKNNIVLLSGYYVDGNSIPLLNLITIADSLDVSVNNDIWKGYIHTMDIESLIKYKDKPEKIWNILTKKYCKNINTSNIEGIVLTFLNRICKVQNPKFQEQIMQHLSDEKEEKNSLNFENIYEMCINSYKICESNYTQPIAKLIELYMAFEVSSMDFFDIEKSLENLDIFKEEEINIKLAQQYYQMFPDNIEDIQYPNLLKFILLVFRNKRAKFPLWCSLEYQENKVNPFLDTYIFNNNI